MTVYNPDAWVIIKLTDQRPDAEDPIIYKVLAGWYGGYLNGDSWKINSGITEVKRYGEYVDLYGYSGSVYRCPYTAERFTGLTASIFSSFEQDMKEIEGAKIEHIDFSQFEREFVK